MFDYLTVYLCMCTLARFPTGTLVTCCSFTTKIYVQMCVTYHGTQESNNWG
jgi:hypothetical protein